MVRRKKGEDQGMLQVKRVFQGILGAIYRIADEFFEEFDWQEVHIIDEEIKRRYHVSKKT